MTQELHEARAVPDDPPAEEAPAEPWWRAPRWRRRAILFGIWAAIAVAAYAFRAVLLPFVGAFLIAYVIEPGVRLLTRLEVRGVRLPRFGAILLLYAGLFGVLWVIGITAVPRLYREAQRLSQAAQGALTDLDEAGIERRVAAIESWLADQGFVRKDPGASPLPAPSPEAAPDPSRSPAGPSEAPAFRSPSWIEGPPDAGGVRLDLAEVARTAVQRVSSALRTGVFEVVGLVQRIAGTVVDAVFHFGLLLMLTAFVSIDIVRIKRVMLTLVPFGYQSDAENLLSRIDAGLSGVVRGQVTIMVINGALTVIGLWLLDVKFVVLLGLMATIFYVVPIFGTILSSVPIVLVALGDSPSKAVGILLWLVGVHMLEAYYLNPKILGDAARIHPVLIVFALLAGEHVGGVVGALLAVPAMSVAIAIFRFMHRRAVELGSLPPLQPGQGAQSD